MEFKIGVAVRKFRELLFLWMFCVLALDNAAQAMVFSKTNLQLLRGHNFQLGPKTRNVLTYEQLSVFKKGDLFFFFDVTDATSEQTSLYGEAVLRGNLNELFHWNTGNFVKGLFLALSLEHNSSGAALYGLSLDLNVPGMDLFQVTYFQRNLKKEEGLSQQITLVWSTQFQMGLPWEFSGFFDWATKEGRSEGWILMQPQLLFNLGKFWNMTDGELWSGLEFHQWTNKFGIKDQNESVIQYMLKWYI
ncbi:MAG: hypothetical protein KDD61_05165 [Bdellovibrionales bacterium]|nr:hypothetical protein [Bdellovibrionales bacterium]